MTAQCWSPEQAADSGRHVPAHSTLLSAHSPDDTSVHTARHPIAPTDLSDIINLEEIEDVLNHPIHEDRQMKKKLDLE